MIRETAGHAAGLLAAAAYAVADFATFGFLMWEDWPSQISAADMARSLPVLTAADALQAAMWPYYWLTIRPVIGH